MQEVAVACSWVDISILITLALSRIRQMCVLGRGVSVYLVTCKVESSISFHLCLCVRYWVPRAQSKGGSAADQLGSAETRSAAPYWDTGKVRLHCYIGGGFFELSQCQNDSTALDVQLSWKYPALSIFAHSLKMMSLDLSFSTLPTRVLSHHRRVDTAAGNKNNYGLIKTSPLAAAVFHADIFVKRSRFDYLQMQVLLHLLCMLNAQFG